SLNLTALYGHNRSFTTTSADGVVTTTPDQKYWTAGAEAFFAIPTISLQGNAGLFHSRRRVDGPTASLPDGDGTMGYLSGTFSWFTPANAPTRTPTVARSLGFLFASGSQDDSGTPENEGYLGEGAKISVDSIFLAAID